MEEFFEKRMLIINTKKIPKGLILDAIKNNIVFSEPLLLDGIVAAKLVFYINPKTHPVAIILLERMRYDDKEVVKKMLPILFYERIEEYVSRRRINIPVTRIIDYEELENGDLAPIGKSITCRTRIKDRFMFGLD